MHVKRETIRREAAVDAVKGCERRLISSPLCEKTSVSFAAMLFLASAMTRLQRGRKRFSLGRERAEGLLSENDKEVTL